MLSLKFKTTTKYIFGYSDVSVNFRKEKCSNLDAVKFYAFILDRGMNKESCNSFKFPAKY